MTTREKILQAVLQNQPELKPLPDISMFKGESTNVVQRYMDVFKTISGLPYLVESYDGIKTLINANFDVTKRMVTTLTQLSESIELISDSVDPSTYEDVELAIIQAHFAVAENGAVWLTDDIMGQQIIPYICQHLAVVVLAESIVPTLHEAYEIIGKGDYRFGGFIGGPSKTADIEQALVLGAHGPLTMTVFILNTNAD
jgi:L-lactate dehydrogenase complex protein LldG